MKQYAHHTDTMLISLWKKGDQQAFDVMYQRHFIRLLNIAHKKTGQLEAAQELVQDVFMGLYQQLPHLDVHTKLENYLFIALRNRIFNYHRQLLSQLRKEQAFIQDQPYITQENNTLLELKELEARMQAGIRELPPQCRTVFLLSREDHCSNKEVAARLNISVNTVEQHMRKALRILRASLGSEMMVVLYWMMMKK